MQSSWVRPVPPDSTTQFAHSSARTTAPRIAGTVSGTIALYTIGCPAASKPVPDQLPAGVGRLGTGRGDRDHGRPDLDRATMTRIHGGSLGADQR